MPTRRAVLAAGAALAASPLAGQAAAPPRRFKAVAFDAFPIFDPRPIAARAEEVFPGRGEALMNVWRTRQFEYAWLRTLSGRHADFFQVTEDALRWAARSLKLELPDPARSRLMQGFLALQAWPDVGPALKALREKGLRLGLVSNFSRKMLDGCLASAGLAGQFEQVLSADLAKAYKPDPRAYQLALEGFGLKREEILFVPFAGWDAAGARAFGFTTHWVNRLGLPPEELGVTPDATFPGLAELVRALG